MEQEAMPIDIATESIVSLTEATKILPAVNGRRPSISTLWRWCRKGLRGVHLEYIRMGRNIATSREALNRFFMALAHADSAGQTQPQTIVVPPSEPAPGVRQASIDRAKRILDAAGI
jgi:hypothetical protein